MTWSHRRRYAAVAGVVKQRVPREGNRRHAIDVLAADPETSSAVASRQADYNLGQRRRLRPPEIRWAIVIATASPIRPVATPVADKTTHRQWTGCRHSTADLIGRC
ncbi:MAG: hypothetical protein VB859_00875 [Planctomycetaceae bacterium]